ncbi:hypothetical protein HAX54_010476, partial [Datura stramonium]|nr:hypothetical protein [Datura stramonium]
MGRITEGNSDVSMMGELTERHMINGPSLAPSPKKEIMPPKFQPTKGGARKRSDRAENTCHLRDENTDYEEKVQEVEINSPSPGYQMRSASRQQAVNPPSNEGNDSSAGGSISRSESPNSDVGIGNEASSSPGLTTTAREHLKRSIAEEVRIIDSELPEYPDIEAKYNFYGLGWMSEAPGNYYPTMVREFYVNYIVVLESLCKRRQKPSEVLMQKSIPFRGEMVDISAETINRMLYGPDFMPPVNIVEFEYWMRERQNQHGWLAQ